MKRIIARQLAVEVKELSTQDIKSVTGGRASSSPSSHEAGVWGEGCTPTTVPGLFI